MGLIYGTIRAAEEMNRVHQAAQRAGNGKHEAPAPATPEITEAAIPAAYRKMPLDAARTFTGDLVWATDPQLDVLTAAIAASHVLEAWDTVFRVLAQSVDKRTGKTTLMHTIRLLGHNPWKATTATSYAVKAKFNEIDPPLIIVEEVNKRFGANGLSGSRDPLATFILDGYERVATTSLSVDRTSVDMPAFCIVAMSGRGKAVHDDILDRSIVFRMKRKPPGVTMPRDALDRDTESEAAMLAAALHAYMRRLLPVIKRLQRKFRPPHPMFVDRLRQIWGPVYLTALASDVWEREQWVLACHAADAQGLPLPPEPACDWAERVLNGFKIMALDSSEMPALLPGQAMLRDAATWFRSGGGWAGDRGRRFGFAADLKDWLAESQEPLWASLTERATERLMTEALGPTIVLTSEGRRARGWAAAPVLQAWDTLEASLLPPLPEPADELSIFDDLPDEDAGHGNHSTDG
jgi:hypothetical protein